MHGVVLQIAPILGAEKSKVPFYIAGGALVVWALWKHFERWRSEPGLRNGAVGAVIRLVHVRQWPEELMTAGNLLEARFMI